MSRGHCLRRQVLVYLNMPTMAQIEAYIGNAASLFDQNGNLTSASASDSATKLMTAFAWMERQAS